jgi:hypothetical protein
VADDLLKSGQASRVGTWTAIRPEALIPAERDVTTGKVLAHHLDGRPRSKDRRDERDSRQPSPAHKRLRGRARRRRSAPVRVLLLAGTALAAVVAGSGIALALTRDHASPPTAQPSPAPVGTSATPARQASATPSGGAGALPQPGQASRFYRGKVIETWPGTRYVSTGQWSVECSADGACAIDLPGSPTSPRVVQLGSGAPGTYPFSFPRLGDPCTTEFLTDAEQGSVVLTETSLSMRSTTAGWHVQCSANSVSAQVKVTRTFSGKLQR